MLYFFFGFFFNIYIFVFCEHEYGCVVITFSGNAFLTNAFVHPDHHIVASFNLFKPVSLVEENVLQLEDNIFDEIVAPSTKVLTLLFFLVSIFFVFGSNVLFEPGGYPIS